MANRLLERHGLDDPVHSVVLGGRGIVGARLGDDLVLDDIAPVGLEALGRQYEVEEEIQIALEKIAPWIHTDKTDNKLFCSGYLEYMFQVTSKPYAKPPNGNATPAWCLDDKDTQPLLWVN